MRFAKPEVELSKQEFIGQFVRMIFPEVKSSGYNAYMSAAEKACLDFEIYGVDGMCELEMDSDAYSVLYETACLCEELTGKKPDILEGDNYRYVTSSVFYRMFQPNSGNLRTFLDEKNTTKKINLYLETAFCFSYLLLKRQECRDTVKDFFLYALEKAGITEIEDTVKMELFSPGLEHLEKQQTEQGTFYRIMDRGTRFFLATVSALMFSVGRYSSDNDRKKVNDCFDKLYAMFENTFGAEMKVDQALEDAEKNLIECIKYFQPRSIPTSQLSPQDFFVMPVFKNGKTNPFQTIRNAGKSRRILVRAKTGLGKSSYLKVGALCMLQKKYDIPGNNGDALEKLSKKMNVPEDACVIFVPARMFSTCYRHARYRGWTKDFTELFLNCMWKLNSSYNFFEEMGVQKGSDYGSADQPDNQHEFTESVRKRLESLAETGRLVLLLDSYDEISSGEVRAAYLRALARFYDEYCDLPEKSQVGAHVIIASREMSTATMDAVNQCLELSKDDMVEIDELNQEQREELLRKWDRFMGISPRETKERMAEIENNHFCREYSVNPYMFSVVCFYLGEKMTEITRNYIKALVDKMQSNNRTADLKDNRERDFVIQEVLRNIETIMQEIAGITVVEGDPFIQKKTIDRHIGKFIRNSDCPEEDVPKYIQRLHEIFVVETGLIVPADGDDNSYQFINNQIRYDLAARGLQAALRDDEKTKEYRERILPGLSSIPEYVGLLVPLICKTDDVQLAELLISDLVMHDFSAAEEESLLIQSMLDLILNRYGSNILTIDRTGENIARFADRAQREVMLRVLSSRAFSPTDREKEELLNAPAYRKHQKWFSDAMKIN